MKLWGITHRGTVRQQNQDAYAVRELEDGRGLAVVCDGMGGARAGNVASSMAVELFMRKLEEQGQPGDDPQKWLKTAAAHANDGVFQKAVEDPDCTGMGTTLVAALAGNGKAVLLNEGDSRAYHITRDGITRITRDHSLVEDMVQRGELTREQARNHPHKNLITRALGAEPVLLADCFEQNVAPGDYLLLCSDGLSNVVTDQEILYEVIHGGEDEACCQRLLDVALHRGAPDNVAVVLMRC